MSADDFEPYRDDTFVVTVDGGAPFDFVLSEVRRGAAHSGGRDPFSLFFHLFLSFSSGQSAPPVAQGIHHLEHPAMGELDIFLVPISADQDKVVFQAVFN